MCINCIKIEIREEAALSYLKSYETDEEDWEDLIRYEYWSGTKEQ